MGGTQDESYGAGSQDASVWLRQISMYKAGPIAVADDVTLHQAVPQNVRVVELFAEIKTQNTGADAIFEVEYNIGAGWVSIGTVTITAVGTGTGTTSGLNVSLPKNALLRLNVDQIGAVVAGSDVGVHVRVKS